MIRKGAAVLSNEVSLFLEFYPEQKCADGIADVSKPFILRTGPMHYERAPRLRRRMDGAARAPLCRAALRSGGERVSGWGEKEEQEKIGRAGDNTFVVSVFRCTVPQVRARSLNA